LSVLPLYSIISWEKKKKERKYQLGIYNYIFDTFFYELTNADLSFLYCLIFPQQADEESKALMKPKHNSCGCGHKICKKYVDVPLAVDV
jgi:hypothetical protein